MSDIKKRATSDYNKTDDFLHIFESPGKCL